MRRAIIILVLSGALNSILMAQTMEDSIMDAVVGEIKKKIEIMFPKATDFNYECSNVNYIAKTCQIETDDGHRASFYCEFSPGLYMSSASCIGRQLY